MNSIPVRDLRVQINAGVQILNLASGVVEKRLSFPGPVHQLDFTDDSRHLVTGNANGTIYVVRLDEWKSSSEVKPEQPVKAPQ